MYKIYIPKVNSEWGIVVRPVGENIYKHIINFPDVSKRDEFISNKFFEGQVPLDFMLANGINCQFNQITSTKTTITFLISDFPTYTIQQMLNADYIPVLNTFDNSILWYQVSGTSNGTNEITYQAELDVFFNYFHLLDIDQNVKINRGHINRQVDNDWIKDPYNPLYNDYYEGNKKVINKDLNLIRKGITGTHSETFQKMIDDGCQIGYAFEQVSNVSTFAPSVYFGNGLSSNNFKLPFEIKVLPLNFIISYENNDESIKYIYNPSDYTKSGTINQVNPPINSEFWLIDFSSGDLTSSYDENSKVLSLKGQAPITGDPIGMSCSFTTNWMYITEIKFNNLSEQHKYELDLTEYKYDGERIDFLENEISSFQNGLRNIAIKQNVNEEEYLLPSYLLGSIVNFELKANIDDMDWFESFELQNDINPLRYEGLNKQNTNYLPLTNNTANQYKTNNKSTFLWSKIGLGIDAIGIASGNPLLMMSGAARLGKNVGNLKDINRQPNTTKGDGYTTIMDLFYLPTQTRRYAVETIEYGNKYIPIQTIYFMFGNVIQKLLNFKDFINTRERFNYIEAEGIFNLIKGIRLSSDIKQLISSSFENGLTIWHYRDETTWNGILDYDSKNNEV